MIRRAADIYPAPLLQEFRRLAALSELPVRIEVSPKWGDNTFCCTPTTQSFYFESCAVGQDYAGLLAAVCWLREGPKIADVSEEQWQALSRVEVRLEVKDFSMPYPTLLVNMPPGKRHRYVLLHQRVATYPPGEEPEGPAEGREGREGREGVPIVIGAAISHDYKCDVVTLLRNHPGLEMETTLGKFSDDVTPEEAESTQVSMRVACNMALAMTSFGCHSQYLFPQEVEREKKYQAKGDRPSRDGRTATDRLREQPVLVSLDRSVVLVRQEGRKKGGQEGQATGREMPFGWRRGHWHMVAHGKGKLLRKRVLYPPTMIRPDLLTGKPSDTTTTYRTPN